MQVFSGMSSRTLTKKVCEKLEIQPVNVCIVKYSSGEFRCNLPDIVVEEHVIYIQSIADPVNESLVESLISLEGIRAFGAQKITYIAPYFGYSRQDFGNAISLKAVLQAIRSAGVDNIITVDPHSKKLAELSGEGFVGLNVDDLVLDVFGDNKSPVIVSPDQGRAENVIRIASKLKTSHLCFNKSRKPNGSMKFTQIKGDIAEKDCIIVDDIVDSGVTLCNVARILRENGAKSVKAFVTHAVLSDFNYAKTTELGLDELIFTDSIDNLNLEMTNGFRSITMSGLIADAIKNACLDDKLLIRKAC